MENKFNEIYEQNENYYNELITAIYSLKKEFNETDENIINMFRMEGVSNDILNDLIDRVNHMQE